MSTQRLRVGFVGGFDVAGNVRTLLENLRRLLAARPTEFDCDLVLSQTADAPDGFDPIEIEAPATTTARSRITTLAREIRRYARREEPDVLVQVTLFPTHGSATAVAGRLTGTPVITRLAGEDFHEHKFATDLAERARVYLLKNVISQAAVHLPDAVIALGPRGRRDLAKRFRKRDVWTIPQPVNRDRFSPVSEAERARLREEIGMPDADSGRVLLTVGRVSRRKGAETIDNTAPALPDDAVWYVVGDGPMRSAISEIRGVRTVGRVPHERIHRYYRAADLYVHPSLHDGLPNVLLEAMACGTPTVARAVGECPTTATETFTDDAELEILLRREYDRVELDEQFHDEPLAERYEELLTSMAR